VDNCPLLLNPGQEDVDDDGVGDVCACAAPRYVFTGPAAEDLFGWRARGAGDVNGDGFDDVIVGASQNDLAGDEAGAAWIYSGADGSPLYALTAESARDRFGRAVSGMGDINGDGFGDFVVSASYNDGGGIDSGRVHVFLAGPGPYPKSLAAQAALYNLTGEAAGDWFGSAVAAVRDLDGDGIRDLLVGASNSSDETGRAYLFSGADGDPIHSWVGEAVEDRFGGDVADAGDFDDDGLIDVIVGAPGNDAPASGSGRAYVYSSDDGSLLLRLSGEAEDDALGTSVFAAGDLNDDGYDDVIVGAPYNDEGAPDAGRVYVVFGRPGPYPIDLGASDADLILTGEQMWERLGQSVSTVGDVDGDGVPDMAIGAGRRGTPSLGMTGQTHVVSGQTGALLQTFPGEAEWDGFGTCVDGSADLNRDGVNDLIVGASGNDAGGTDAGRIYLYLLGDVDGDGFSGGCDTCPRGFNPDQGLVALGQTIVATGEDTFSWTAPQDVEWVRGDLDAVSTYATDESGTLLDAVSLTDVSEPLTGRGFYYLVKLGCEAGSWQTGPDAEPQRDAMLP